MSDETTRRAEIIHAAGICNDDPGWDEFMETVKQNRKERTAREMSKPDQPTGVPAKLTEYGFQFGAALVERVCSDVKTGSVTIIVTTPKHSRPFEIYVTKTGKVRIFQPDGGEMKGAGE